MVIIGVLVAYSLGRTFLTHQTAGMDEMIGLIGRSASPIGPTGKVFVRGEYWNVVSDEPIEEGQSVEVVSVDGLTLLVRKVENSR
jgi:membrane-bound serine protease (ClpP class)